MYHNLGLQPWDAANSCQLLQGRVSADVMASWPEFQGERMQNRNGFTTTAQHAHVKKQAQGGIRELLRAVARCPSKPNLLFHGPCFRCLGFEAQSKAWFVGVAINYIKYYQVLSSMRGGVWLYGHGVTIHSGPPEVRQAKQHHSDLKDAVPIGSDQHRGLWNAASGSPKVS